MSGPTAPLRLAIVGAGKIAQDQHLPSVAATSDFDLVAIVDQKHSVPILPHFATIEDLLENGPPVDAVAICTPPQVRGGIARTAISAGKHVLLEKPPAATLSEAEHLQYAARAGGVTLFAAWHSRFAPMVATARTWLASRTIIKGEINWREDVRVWHPGQTWLWQAGGMGVFDPGINALSILTAICPAPVHLATASFETPSNVHTPIAAALSLRCGDAPIETAFDFRQTGAACWDIRLETNNGTMMLQEGGARLVIDETELRGPPAEYQAVYARFAELVAAGDSDMDIAPLRLVADAFLIADHKPVAFFIP
jgi:D-galactose 1-dehydrogenase